MKRSPITSLLRRLRDSFESEADALTDAELLERWLEQRDQAAFENLVWRLGPLVLGICRRLLRQAEDIDDAFQTSFLILVRKATSIRGRSLSGWLYRVAYHVCLRLRSGRDRLRETPVVAEPAAAGCDDLLWRDLRPVLDQEIGRLPERYRVAFVLCYLQGKTNAGAARELGCPVGTILSRLAWARERLRDRLGRRGVTLTVVGLLGLLSQSLAEAAPTSGLVAVVVRLPGGEVPAAATSLAKGVIQTMTMIRVKVTTGAALFVLGLLGLGVGLLPRADGEASGAEEPRRRLLCGAPPDAAPAKQHCKVPSERDGILVLIGTDIKEGEKVPAKDVVKVRVGGEEKQFRRLRAGDKVQKGQLLARLDDRLALDEVEIKASKADAAEAERVASEKTGEEAKKRYELLLKRYKNQLVSEEELRGAELTWQRYVQEEIAKKAAVRQAQLELKSAKTILSMYEIRSPVTGVIQAIYKQRGEGVKALEPILLIEYDDD